MGAALGASTIGYVAGYSAYFCTVWTLECVFWAQKEGTAPSDKRPTAQNKPWRCARFSDNSSPASLARLNIHHLHPLFSAASTFIMARPKKVTAEDAGELMVSVESYTRTRDSVSLITLFHNAPLRCSCRS